ncbi:non-homologous end-joining DNA ligase [Wenjunlia tyrosinilytica]|uniref:non-homologous end-joining DNA ligase n=1 Tax=Wenjunlia tyrosinilytica TaxID=1544741 RepID=UPI00166E817D|nr:non-homologous end-joining DNA ligase [Wenjunlia tyrosinilytica]
MNRPARGTAPAQLPLLSPMLATQGTVPTDPWRWAFEVKWDGIRVLAYLPGDGGMKLVSRNNNDVTFRYPELADLPALLPGEDVILDAEIVAVDSKGRPSFARLQERMNLDKLPAIKAATRTTPVSLMVFDILWRSGGQTTSLPYRARRELLEGMGMESGRIGVPPAWHGEGDTAMTWTLTMGLEGVIAKRLDSRYWPGKRSRDWIKIKHWRTLDVLIGGWIPSDRAATVMKSLLVGLPEGGGLRYCGAVGSGFTHADRTWFATELRRLEMESPPFFNPRQALERGHPVRWCEPVLTGEVEFFEWTPAGQMRQPVWRGLRGEHGP